MSPDLWRELQTNDVHLEPRDAKDEAPQVDGEIIKERISTEKKKGMKKLFGALS